jgi:hypothetical protein
MPGFRLPFRSAESLGASLADLPTPVKSAIGRGFKTFERIGEATSLALVEAASHGLAGRDVDVRTLARRFSMTEEDVGEALTALAIMLIAVAAENVSPEAFVSDAIEAQLIPSSDRAVITKIANTVQTSREEIKSRLDRELIAARVLPSLAGFRSAIEIRLAFKEDRIATLVPVVVAYLETDATHAEVWFQMSKGQAEDLARDLREVVKRLEEAEKLIQKVKIP